MWYNIFRVKALDVLMDQLKITGMDFQDISAISGSGQVYSKLRHYYAYFIYKMCVTN